MSAVPLVQYVQDLKASSVTLNWDVAVIYNAQKINKKLEEKFNKNGGSGIIKRLELQVSLRDRHGPYTQYYDINLGEFHILDFNFEH